jgi:hypothetical protein
LRQFFRPQHDQGDHKDNDEMGDAQHRVLNPKPACKRQTSCSESEVLAEKGSKRAS